MSDLTASAWLDDWFAVEANGGVPEGSEADWREIIALMRKQECGAPATRVGVTFRMNGSVELFSPRNAYGDNDYALIPASDVEQWIEKAEALLDSIPQAKIDAAVEELSKLTDEQRMSVFREFCTDCGSKSVPCGCVR